MAFHVACPITCRKICFCTLGFPSKLHSEKEQREFLEEISRVEEFLRDPWTVRAGGRTTVQIPVPKIVVGVGTAASDGFGVGEGEEVLSVQNKRAALQKRAAAASLAAEDYARRFETGNLAPQDVTGEAVTDLTGEDHGSSVIKVMCRLCFSGENEGSDRAARMLPCKICNKKYHRNCLKRWGAHRDLFHWSSWACPSCRICEVCRRAGDPNKFMFCKRCDGAYHCYCQQPPHKNVTPGPFLCSKHTRCHSCRSTVSGSGFSTRWFLGYTFCDACGRLFVKGNYCPVCLKVYRDTEPTPMVCCDHCQRWVHCQCDGISDEKYLQFQADRNLQYKCAACRGDCYQVGDLDDAVQELWRRRDEADRDQIASLRAAAGLPSQEDTISVSPFSDDEENGPVIVKTNYGRSLKLSVKGFVEKTPKSNKEYGKKSSKGMSLKKKYAKKKGYQLPSMDKTEEQHQSFEKHYERQSLEGGFGNARTDDKRSYRTEVPGDFSPDNTRNPGNTIEKSGIRQPGNVAHKIAQEAVVHKNDRNSKVIHIKSRKSQGSDPNEAMGEHTSKNETTKGTKLVIHFASRNRNLTDSPRSEASSYQKEHLTHTNGGEYKSQQMANDGRVGFNSGVDLSKNSKQRGRESSLIKLGKAKSKFSEVNSLNNRVDAVEQLGSTDLDDYPVVSRRNCEATVATESMVEDMLQNDGVTLRKESRGTSILLRGESQESGQSPSGSGSSTKDTKPLLKLKFKNPYFGTQSSWIPQGEEEKTSVKGQRSKRKRPSNFTEKALVMEDEKDGLVNQEDSIDEVMDANWILKKLGKDAIGKRVEVHQLSDNSWHKGVVTDMVRGSSSLAVHLDDGISKILELGKQGVRLIPQKQKRSKT